MHTPKTAPVLAVMPIADAQMLRMATKGSFHVDHEADAQDRCGPKGATRQMDYTVTVESMPAMLDDQGFLIDWQAIRRYFPAEFTKVSHFPSCEQIAVKAVRDIANMLPGKLGSVTVTVGFHGGPAEMTAIWNAPAGWFQCVVETERYSHEHK
jgi:hypothetical protein